MAKLIPVSEIPHDSERAEAQEAAYRRGVHQASSQIADELERCRNITDARRFANRLTDVLRQFRFDRQEHPLLLHEAIIAVHDYKLK